MSHSQRFDGVISHIEADGPSQRLRPELIFFGLLTETERPHGPGGDPSRHFDMDRCTPTVVHEEPRPPTQRVERSWWNKVMRLNHDSQFVNGRSRI
jgi:hypothetical protein